MIKVSASLTETQRECKEFGIWLQAMAPEIENFFAMLHNHAMSAQEILDAIGNLRVKTKKEAEQRIMLVLRSAWVFSLSVVEYSMKRIIRHSSEGPLLKWYNTLEDNKHVLGTKRGFSMRSVVTKSHKLGLIDDKQYQSWIGLQEMRNAIIHNNGFLEQDKTFTIGHVIKKIKTGEKVRYSHQDGAFFIRLIPLMSKRWLESYLDTHKM